MVNFEYKVVGLRAFTPGQKDSHTDASDIEAVINQCASEGWEYQNNIFFPTVHTADNYIVYPRVNLIFRRAKS